MASESFEVAGHTYKAAKILPRTQFHIMRRLAGVIDGMRDVLKLGVKRDPLSMAAPMMKAIAAMPDADCDYVLDACLSVCQRKDGAGWAKVWNDQAKQPMYDDIGLSEMIRIAVNVLKDSFADFFRELPFASIDATGEGGLSL